MWFWSDNVSLPFPCSNETFYFLMAYLCMCHPLVMRDHEFATQKWSHSSWWQYSIAVHAHTRVTDSIATNAIENPLPWCHRWEKFSPVTRLRFYSSPSSVSCKSRLESELPLVTFSHLSLFMCIDLISLLYRSFFSVGSSPYRGIFGISHLE